MSNNVSITPGAGVVVAGDDVSGVIYQRVKLDIGGPGVSVPVPGDGTYGIKVDITRFPAAAVLVNNPTAANLKVDASGAPVPITDNAGSLTVDAPAATPVAVRLSTGSAFIDTIPISGSITAAQGAPAVAANRWKFGITDGTTEAAVDAGTGGVKVYIAGGLTGGGTSLADKATFTEGTSLVTPMGGEFIAAPSDPTDGHVAAARITVKRAVHINLRDNTGVELGTSGNALRIDPIGTTAQPVNLRDNAGTAYSAANPLYVTRGGRAQTRVTKSVSIAASTTATVWTPTGGKKFFITKIILAVSVTGTLTLFDHTNTAPNLIFNGTFPTGVFPFSFEEPWASSAVDNLLRYTSGSGMTAEIVVHGFEV